MAPEEKEFLHDKVELQETTDIRMSPCEEEFLLMSFICKKRLKIQLESRRNGKDLCLSFEGWQKSWPSCSHFLRTLLKEKEFEREKNNINYAVILDIDGN